MVWLDKTRVRQDELLALLRRWRPAAHILVLDDDLDTRQVLRAILEKLAHQVIEAANGPIALVLIPELQLDVVLLDLMMPDAVWRTISIIC